jgi:hypothetical protein
MPIARLKKRRGALCGELKAAPRLTVARAVTNSRL